MISHTVGCCFGVKKEKWELSFSSWLESLLLAYDVVVYVHFGCISTVITYHDHFGWWSRACCISTVITYHGHFGWWSRACCISTVRTYHDHMGGDPGLKSSTVITYHEHFGWCSRVWSQHISVVSMCLRTILTYKYGPWFEPLRYLGLAWFMLYSLSLTKMISTDYLWW